MEMKSDRDASDLVDPLVDKSPFSLYHRTFKSSSSSTSSTNLPNPNSFGFNALDSHFNARVLSSPELLKQTKIILEEAVLAEKEKVPRERRPALGLKREKFSVKSKPSQPAVSLDFTLDVDKLSDPEEFFAAFERMENAKKEVQRLKGESLVDLDLNQASLIPRHRRPSLLGRSATYRHRAYPSISAADVNETLSPSQETFDIRSPTRNDVLPDANVTNKSPSVKVPESKSTTTSYVSEIDELLAFNYEGLEEDEVQNFLRDKLSIKSVDVGKANLPDWCVQLSKSWTTSSAMQKKNDEVFHLSGKSNTIRNRDHVSPMKSKSPLASFSLLNRYIAKCRPSRDPFSPQCIDSSPAEATHPTREPEKRVDQAGQSIEVDARKNLCEFSRSSAYEEEDITVSNEVPLASAAKDFDPISEPKEKEDVVGKFDGIGNRMGSCDFGSSPVHVENNVVSGEDSPVLASNVVAPTSEPERPEDEVDAAQLPAQQLNFEGIDRGNSSSSGAEKGGTGEPSNTDNISVEEPIKETMGSPKKRLNEEEKSKASSEAIVLKETVKKGRQAKRFQLEAPVSGEAKSKRRKGEGAQPGLSKGDKELRRTSLYYAGTKWEAGVRRSTRIRMRPLEYWRGERFLYGRVHQSLVTVIGVKYASPTTDAEPGVKVKSFVPDEYKDLVEFASLH